MSTIAPTQLTTPDLSASPPPFFRIPAGRRLVFRGVSRDVYESLSQAICEGEYVRLAYDGKDLEIMVTSNLHEYLKGLLGRFVTAVITWRNIACLSCGETTWQSPQRGLEADHSYEMVKRPLRWILGHPVERGRIRRSPTLFVDSLLEDRVVLSTLDSVHVGSVAEISEMARTPKPPNLAPYVPAAKAIYNNRLPAYVNPAAKTQNLNTLKLAFHQAHLPVSGAIHVSTEPIYNFDDNNGTLITWGLKVGRHPVYAVQTLISPTGIITNTYVGQTNPSTVVLLPSAEPVTPERLQADLSAAFQKSNLTFGPVNETAFMADLYSRLSQEGLPSESYNIITNLSAIFSGDGTEVSILIGFLLYPNSVAWAEAVLKDDGTYLLQTVVPPSLIPVPNPVPSDNPGNLSSVFRL